MNRFIMFNDKKVDSFLFMELSDLVKTLTKDEQMELEFGYQSYLDRQHKKVVVSHFWDNRPKEQYVYGLKSDVFCERSEIFIIQMTNILFLFLIK
ncbi:hypothetical protein LR68_03493 [Anoxybacillus sp. BCO1]|nr:hypothetical protein LR68_03493 [Anoxybacillus sp. BCO1]